ncbi:NUDIX hydrolase [Halobacillus sp. BAB-2008]|uniref:NUDIX hydrolase n=1 Tax=Halobacillus sp. BAB-2008 TaxID=1246484 RepID=UPI0002A52464|nr:NUDIX hydrolase [Halobacillus sp. BAB-2008]ELK45830.1 MutT/nudix family protein [Halobacillus sp. BAB-2008]
MSDYVMQMRKLIGTRPLIVPGSTVLVFNDSGELLLQHRSDTEEWGLPGGAMEPGESLEETAARELFEKTGLRAEGFTFIDQLSGKEFYFKYPNGDEVYNVIGIYEAQHTFGKLAMADGESIDLRYFPIDGLPSNVVDWAKLVIGAYKRFL